MAGFKKRRSKTAELELINRCLARADKIPGMIVFELSILRMALAFFDVFMEIFFFRFSTKEIAMNEH